MPEMTITAYLAGPDVFLPNAREHARRKVELCARYGIAGRAPLDENTDLKALSGEMTWDEIFGQNLAMMEGSDAIIANLTPFRGASADAGTLVELGWFLGRGRPAFGYSQVALPFAERSRQQIAAVADPLPGVVIEEFDLPDNLMVAGALLASGNALMVPHDGRARAFDALDLFERCVALAAAALGGRS